MAKIHTNPFSHLDESSLPTFAGLKTISLDSPMTQYGLSATKAMAGSWFGNLWKNLHYYFDVTNAYVVKKLQLILFPFTSPGDWQQELDNEGVPASPRFNPHAPDLYIPLMSFITFVLISGLRSGYFGTFSPQILGITSSTCIVFLCFELLFVYGGFYFLQSALPSTLDLIAYCGYKFVPCAVISMIHLLVGGQLYFPVFGYFAGCFAIFIVGFM
jgi:hypothetical protein